jgi:hypothetical protein
MTEPSNDLILKVAVGLAAFVIFYVVTGAVYRLFFSPVAKFPGPKLTALTLWYEFYYDVIKGGQFIFQIRRMHEKYGRVLYSVVRRSLGNC